MSLFHKANYDLCVVALGNPGEKYKNTRHNTGFMMLDKMAEKCGVSIDRLKHKALCGEWRNGDKRILLVKPQTFMNLSGESVGEIARYYKIPPERILIVCDDISRPFGKVRIRLKGSAGGHNGLKSIEQHLGTQEYPRLKFGIGDRPDPRMDLADWVLGKWDDKQTKAIEDSEDILQQVVLLMAEGKAVEAVSRYSH